jgi:hypothetical protein
MTTENTSLDLGLAADITGETTSETTETTTDTGFDLNSLPFDKVKEAYLTKIQDATEREVYEKNLSSIKDMSSLINSFVHSQKALGSKITIPGKDATAEEWDKFYTKAGRPATQDQYDLKNEYLEFDENVSKEIKDGFFAAGLTAKQASTVVTKIAEISDKSAEARKAAIEASKTKVAEEKATLFGKDLVRIEAEVDDYIKGIVTTKEDLEDLSSKIKADPKLLSFVSKLKSSSTPKSPNDLNATASTGYKTSREIRDEIMSNPAYKQDWFQTGGRNMPTAVVARLRAALQDPKLFD